MPRARQAFGREDKDARRKVILAAPTRLFRQGRGDLPSIAGVAGLGKGTIYLYFPKRETIFAALLLDGWRSVLELVERAFPPVVTDNHDAVGTFLSAYVGHLDVHREVLRLDALRPMLENNLDSKPSIAVRRTFREWLIAGGEQIDRALDLTPGRGLKLLTRTHALTCGLWRQVEPGTIGDTAAGPIASSDFAHDLSEALAEYWRGALLS